MTFPLPQELFDTITDWVAHLEPDSASLSSLKALALTSRQHFTHRVQSHLFRMMIVAQDENKAMKNMLAGNPSLFKHVRSLAIALQYAHPDVRDETNEPDLEFTRLMLHVLDYLDNITALVVISLKSDATHTHASEWATWTRISPAWREMLNKAFKNPSINTLFLLGLRNIPVSKIYAMPNLSLILLEKNSGFTREEDPEGSEEMGTVQNRRSLDLPPMQLRWISLHRSGILAASLIPSLCNVPHLTLEIVELDQHVAVWDILENGPPRLESLALRYSNRISSSRRNSNLLSECLSEFKCTGRALPTLPNLRYLTIVANAFHDFSEPEWLVSIPPHVPRFFTALIGQSPQPNLEIVDIAVQWGVAVEQSGLLPSGAPLMVDWKRAEWARLDEILSSRGLFPRLQAVRALAAPEIKNFPIAKHMEATFEGFVVPQAKREMLSALPKCSARTTLDVDLDEGVEKRVDDMIRRILPGGFLERVESMLT